MEGSDSGRIATGGNAESEGSGLTRGVGDLPAAAPNEARLSFVSPRVCYSDDR